MSDEITRLNQWYLNSLRCAAVRDLPGACATFGVTKEFAEGLCEMSTDEIEAAAIAGRTLFQPVVDVGTLRAIANVPSSTRAAIGHLALGEG